MILVRQGGGPASFKNGKGGTGARCPGRLVDSKHVMGKCRNPVILVRKGGGPVSFKNGTGGTGARNPGRPVDSKHVVGKCRNPMILVGQGGGPVNFKDGAGGGREESRPPCGLQKCGGEMQTSNDFGTEGRATVSSKKLCFTYKKSMGSSSGVACCPQDAL